MADAKKCWRQKVTAEITLQHLEQFARETGAPLNSGDALTFLNQDGRAYEMWKHMMRAGEQYIKSQLVEQHAGACSIDAAIPYRARRVQ